MIEKRIPADRRNRIALGRRGEHNARAVVFDVGWYQERFPGGSAQVLHQRHGDTVPYLATITQNGDKVIWTLTSDDTARTGIGRAELRWYQGSTLCKSVTYATTVYPTLAEAGSIPTSERSALDLLTEAVTHLQESWENTSATAGGISPAVTVTPISGGHRVSITDADHPGGQSFDVMDGMDAGRHVVYGFRIDSTESDPAACVTYLADAVGMTPAYMDFTNNRFVWGSWQDAFFLPRPCMLKYDGTVDYYLDTSDYSQKAYGGGASDVADDTYGGNAMMEWGQGGKKIWYKIVPDTNDNTSASVYIADHQADSGFHAWSFINNQGNMVDHFYTPIYNGSIDSTGRLRSISGRTYDQLCQGKTVAQEIAAAELNNVGTDKVWYTEVYADVILIDLLLILMGKSLDTQGVFGTGRTNQPSAVSSMLGTGTMDDKGLFYGSSGNSDGVKVFGMENWWANQWRRYAGHVMVDYVHKYKMTRGTLDGSTAEDYNTTANGYLTGATAPQTTDYITKMTFDANQFGASAVDGTALTYYCDQFAQASGTRYASRGGRCSSGAICGAFFDAQSVAPSSSSWYIGAAPSCKPLS